MAFNIPGTGGLVLPAGSTASTPAQFDTSTLIATMEAVGLAKGSYSGYRALASSTVLTAADVGKYISVETVSNITITLPQGSSVAVGSVFTFGAMYQFTLARSGTTDLIKGPTSTGSSVSMYGICSVVWRGDGYWQVVIGGDAVTYGANYFHQRTPSGLIYQGISTSAPINTGTTVTFPLAFPNACLQVQVTHGINATASISIGVGTLSKTGALIYHNASAPASFYILAIGN